MNLIFSDVYRSVNYIGSLAKFARTGVHSLCTRPDTLSVHKILSFRKFSYLNVLIKDNINVPINECLLPAGNKKVPAPSSMIFINTGQ